jgi:DNA repair photolyase
MAAEFEDSRVTIEPIVCKSALTGAGTDFRLNPYVGCEHNCAYCYATFICKWKQMDRPWGSWVQAKKNIVSVLQRELERKRGVSIFFSTVCDPYQGAEQQWKLTRECLEILFQASVFDPFLRVFLLTKSDLILRDIDILRQFPSGSLETAFSVCLFRDEIAAAFEPCAPRPSRRLAAARQLKAEGIKTGILINPILPYFTEQDLPRLLDTAETLGLDYVGFDMLNYLHSHVGEKLRPVYAVLGSAALRRFEQARSDPSYETQVKEMVRGLIRGRKMECRW